MVASPRSTLFAVMLVTVLGTAGIALPYPLLTPFFLEPDHHNALISYLGLPPKLLLGFLLALYPLGILLGSPFIGALSDQYGRKHILLISLMVAAAGYALTALAVYLEHYPLFALARFLTGLCEGNIAVSRAIALDLHPQIERTRSMSLVFTMTYAGWLIGPLAGGYLVFLGVGNVFLLAGLVTLLAVGLVQLMIADPLPVSGEARSFWHALSKENSLSLIKVKSLQPLLIYHLLFNLGLNLFYEFYPFWLVEKFHFNSSEIGLSTVAITLSMIAGSIYVVPRLAGRVDSLFVVTAGSLMLSVLFMLLPLANLLGMAVVFAACGLVIALTSGVFPAYVAARFGELGQGRVMGLLTTNFCLGNVIAAIGGSFIALMGSGWSLFCGGILCLLSTMWIQRVRQSTDDQSIIV
jgi:MFS transporter, DHA1 family, tetracycline resistance protein